MLIALLIACCLLGGLETRQSRGIYTIVAPGTIRSNSDYHVSVALDDFSQSCWFNISLHIYNDEQILDNTIAWATVEVEPRTTKLLKIELPKLFDGFGVLRVAGFRGIITNERSEVNIEERQYTPYIQTDKGKYKPGEIMRFRVIFIDRRLRPAKVDAVIDVNIYDGQTNLIRKFADIKLVQGVFKGSLQLSEYPVLGEWVIEVTADGGIMKEDSFLVARYALKRFSVDIRTKKNIAVDDGKLVVFVKSSYTFGQPVNGNLTIHVNSTSEYYHNPIFAVTKEFVGSKEISIDFEKDLDKTKSSFLEYTSEIYPYIVTATVTEELTGQSRSVSSAINLHYRAYKVKLKVPERFDVHELVNITVTVTDLDDNPIRDRTTPIEITIRQYEYNMKILSTVVDIQTFDYRFPPPIERTIYPNENGIGILSLKIPDEQQFSEYRVTAKYLDCTSYPAVLKRKTLGSLQLDVLTESPEVGKDIVYRLASSHPIEYFAYELISHGDIIHSQRINLPNNETMYYLRINATYTMVPKVTLFVHRIKEGILNSRLKDVYIQRAFKNTINITTEEEVLPGTLVALNVTTNTGSYVGLMGIDEKLLLDKDYKDTLTEDNIYSDIISYDPINIDRQIYPGREAGLITFSNACNMEGVVIGHPTVVLMGPGAVSGHPKVFKFPTVDLPRVRKLFSDSWMFNDFERTPEEGLQIRETIPDTITSWVITGFSLNPETGLTLTKNATKVKVFQPFFISMDLPSLVKKDELVEINVYVFNYMADNLLTDVTIESPSADVEILERLTSELQHHLNHTLSKSISSKDQEKFVFLVKPRKPGHFNITVRAMSRLASDAVQKTLNVEPDGVPYSISKTYLIHLHEDGQQLTNEISIEVPEYSVPDSEGVHLSVVGDVFGLLMKSLQILTRVPYGNGEDNMRNTVSNMLVLKYLKTFNYTNPSLESKAKLHLELGYQTQLSLRQLDGSFSRFDRTIERTGDLWLSAYTMWTLQQAKDFIQLDEKVIQRGLEYLKRKQSDDGGYNSGKGVDEDVALTALAVLAYLLDEESQTLYQHVITKALLYLHNVLDDLEQPSSAAIAMYALVMGKHEKSEQLLMKLATSAVLTSQQLQWTNKDNIQSNLETTSYIFMCLLESQEISLQSLYPMLKSLLSPGQGKRTPGHMLALEAMIKFAHHIDVGANNLNIRFEGDQGDTGDLWVNPENSQAVQKVKLMTKTRDIKLNIKGKGLALVSLSYKYNLVPENQLSTSYQTNVTVKVHTEQAILLDVCVSIKPPVVQAKLTIMEVNLQSGYTIYESSFERIMQDNYLIKSIELKEGAQSVKVCLENVTPSGTCIKFGGMRTFRVFDLKPISVIVYDEDEDQLLVINKNIGDEDMNKKFDKT